MGKFRKSRWLLRPSSTLMRICQNQCCRFWNASGDDSKVRKGFCCQHWRAKCWRVEATG